MARITRKLVVVVLILVGAGIATAATSPVIMGPSVGISSPASPLTQVAPSTSTTTGTSGGVTTTTTGNTTTVTGSGSSTTPTPGTTTPSTPVPGVPVGIEQIVSVTRTVEAGAPVSAFAVPAGNRLVITDVVITNPGTAPACGASVAASAATPAATATGATATTGTTTSTTGTTTGATTGAATGGVTVSATTDTGGTGVLCVPAQTSLTLALTTGLEFAAGHSVVLANQVAGATTSGPLSYHLRGFLISGV
jgi:hypothetical protein